MYSTILLPVDLDQEASWSKALPVVERLCPTFGASLCVMTVIPGFTMAAVEQYFPPRTLERLRADAEAALTAFVRDRVAAGLAAATVVAEGRIYEQILATARRIGADLIVMASHSPGLQDYLLGPNAARVVRHAPVSVLVVR